jgi:hypothetical protein
LETAINVKPLCRKNFLSYITKRQTGQPISRCFEKVVLLQLIYQEFNIYIYFSTNCYIIFRPWSFMLCKVCNIWKFLRLHLLLTVELLP